MCTLNDTELEDVVQCMDAKPATVPIGALCKKCTDRKAEVVLRVRDAYCRKCFLVAATHKFRAVLGKSKMVKLEDKVLLAFSGSQSSVALLHLIKAGLDETSHRRLRCTPCVVYIDEGAILEQTRAERQHICIAVAELVCKYELPVFISILDRSLDYTNENDKLYYNLNPSTKLNINEKRDVAIQDLINSVHSLTAKYDLLQKLRNRLLFKIAEQLECSKIFVAETGTDLAIKLMTNLSLGRGAQLPLDIGFCDSRHPDIQLLRPMRDFMKKEVVFYNLFNGLIVVNNTSLGTKTSPYSSIQKLTETFVTELQENFPSTVSTVFRTGEKLSLENDSAVSEESCVLCQAPLDTSHIESSALQATEFSHMVSALGPLGFDNQSLMVQSALPSTENLPEGGICCTEGQDSNCHCRKKLVTHITHAQAKEWLCYGCRLITREMDSFDALPCELIQTIKERWRIKQMRNEIQDFLL